MKTDKLRNKFPENEKEAEEAARRLADEMNKLSLEEHEQIMFDVHGLDQTLDEDPGDLDRHIAELEEQISRITEKPSYQRALYFNKSYVHDKHFLLMFLRSDRFDTKQAAERFIKHFEVKEKLFGSGEILGRDIRLSDMTEEDMAILESGYIQILPKRDLAGRSVVFYSMMHRPKDASLLGLNRTYWYMLTTTLKDEETQKKGVVGVTYNFGDQAVADRKLILTQLDSVIQAIPKKIMGVHYCFKDAALKPYVMGVHLYLDKTIQGRFRPHFGENTQFELQTYGIPTMDQPIHPNGEISLAWHREWLKVRKIQEESEGSAGGIVIPRRFDVLFGRGKGSREHTGNLRTLHLVELFQSQYDSAEKQDKTHISARVVTIVKESLGRFLKWEDDGWVEVNDTVARQKVSHFFRHQRSKQMGHHKSATEEDSTECLEKRVAPIPVSLSLDRDRASKHSRTDTST